MIFIIPTIAPNNIIKINIQQQQKKDTIIAFFNGNNFTRIHKKFCLVRLRGWLLKWDIISPSIFKQLIKLKNFFPCCLKQLNKFIA